jgi:hypothetical protein
MTSTFSYCLEKLLENRTFAVVTKTVTKTGDLWHSTPIPYSEAFQILIHNGWSKNDANLDLHTTPNQFIMVNGTTQIT